MSTTEDSNRGPESALRLTELPPNLSRLADTLRRPEKLRQERIEALRDGARFAGLDELLRHLDALAETFREEPTLRRAAFLVYRSVADFEIAIEAAISGYLSVAADAMRDVMEIENLLLDFSVDPSGLDDWLNADSRTLRTRYAPAQVRQRLHKAGVGAFASGAEAPDYRAHSEALHVRPGRHPIAPRGFSADAGWNGDAAYWEMFEHHRRLHAAIRRFTASLAPESDAAQIAETRLTRVDDAWTRTQEMQAIFVELLKAATTQSGPAER